jgi:hypothetical protein
VGWRPWEWKSSHSERKRETTSKRGGVRVCGKVNFWEESLLDPLDACTNKVSMRKNEILWTKHCRVHSFKLRRAGFMREETAVRPLGLILENIGKPVHFKSFLRVVSVLVGCDSSNACGSESLGLPPVPICAFVAESSSRSSSS